MIPAIVSALGQAGAASGGAGGLTSAVSGLAGGGNVGQLAGSLKSLGSPMNMVTQATNKFAKSLNTLPDKIGEVQQMIVSTGTNWVNALAAPIDTIKQLGDAIGRFTRLSNPGGMKMFDYHVERAMATIGNILDPILGALTRGAEKMGDMFAKLKPALSPAIEAVTELIDFFTTRFADSMEFLAPGIKMVSELVLGLVKAFQFVQAPITAVIRGIISLRNSLYDMLGIPRSFDKDAKADFAVKEPRYIGAEDLFREQAKNSLMASMATGAEKPKTTESLLEAVITKLKDLPRDIAEAIANKILKVEIWKELRQGVEQVQNRAEQGGGLAGLISSRW